MYSMCLAEAHPVAAWYWHIPPANHQGPTPTTFEELQAEDPDIDRQTECGICQRPFEQRCPAAPSSPQADAPGGTCSGIPGEECPLEIGPCRHAFHLHCMQRWVARRQTTCPFCRAVWHLPATRPDAPQ
ncbi:hypothetical protein H696_01661 [Fonticula alba]|uniref:RING-type domain-containing protein n=1 Tax=Fonticula alba TaxID=691883 RepID=A0A058ZD04_FONAL|nr:hypothetical protein H696_01661 [Fonticula alba]KCV72264.1 hypothetical protein H696_01661 [Fonticula alba]|eukprot:XP_009493842.1 hypothetical protein H696_01661 [Fonticula alba]